MQLTRKSFALYTYVKQNHKPIDILNFQKIRYCLWCSWDRHPKHLEFFVADPKHNLLKLILNIYNILKTGRYDEIIISYSESETEILLLVLFLP